MNKQEIEKLANKYLNDIIKPRNPNWMDYITDSWLKCSEYWFCNEYEIATGFACPQDKIDIFNMCIYQEANKARDKKYGIRNGHYIINSVYKDIQKLQGLLDLAIELFNNGDNPDNEYIPLTEIKDTKELLSASENKLSKFAS